MRAKENANVLSTVYWILGHQSPLHHWENVFHSLDSSFSTLHPLGREVVGGWERWGWIWGELQLFSLEFKILFSVLGNIKISNSSLADAFQFCLGSFLWTHVYLFSCRKIPAARCVGRRECLIGRLCPSPALRGGVLASGESLPLLVRGGCKPCLCKWHTCYSVLFHFSPFPSSIRLPYSFSFVSNIINKDFLLLISHEPSGK